MVEIGLLYTGNIPRVVVGENIVGRKYRRLMGNRPGHNVHITTRMPSQQFEDIITFYDSTSSELNGENMDGTGGGNVSSTLTEKIEEKIEKMVEIVADMEKRKNGKM